MKKQYSFSLNVDSEAARYMECIRHKRGTVLEALIIKHLADYGGYLSQEVAADAGYRFSEKDRAFAEWFLKENGAGVSERIKSSEEIRLTAKKKTGKGRKKGSQVVREMAMDGGEDSSSRSGDRVSAPLRSSQGNRPPDDLRPRDDKETEGDQFPRDDRMADSASWVKNQDMILSGLSAFLG